MDVIEELLNASLLGFITVLSNCVVCVVKNTLTLPLTNRQYSLTPLAGKHKTSYTSYTLTLNQKEFLHLFLFLFYYFCQK